MPSTPNPSTDHYQSILREEKLSSYLKNVLTTLTRYVKTFNIDNLEYNGALCSFMEQVPALYVNTNAEVIVNESCSGTTGPKGEKFGCAGAAIVLHKFKQGKKQEVVQHKMETSRRSIQAVTTRLTDAIPYKLAQAVTLIKDLVDFSVSEYKQSHQDQEESQTYKQASLSIFYALCDGLSDEMVECPPIRNLFSCLLEYLGQEVIAQENEEVQKFFEQAHDALDDALNLFDDAETRPEEGDLRFYDFLSRTKESQTRKVESYLDVAGDALGISSISNRRQQILDLRESISENQRNISTFKRKRISAPASTFNPLGVTKSGYDKKIAVAKDAIVQAQNSIEVEKENFVKDLNRIGMDLDSDSIDNL